MLVKSINIKTITLLLIIMGISLLKDHLTPDYRNTPAARFLDPHLLTQHRLQTLFTHPMFWTKSLLYSLVFVLLPTYTIQQAFNQKTLTKLTLLGLSTLAIALYACIFIQSNTLDHLLVSKINRYLHSPILVLFLWAAYTITTQPNESK